VLWLSPSLKVDLKKFPASSLETIPQSHHHTYIDKGICNRIHIANLLFGVKSGCVQMSFGAATSSVTQLKQKYKQQKQWICEN
jgi:hypothetical protein